MKLSHEMIEKAKAAESAEEFLEIAKENGIDMTADEAKTYFEQLNANSLDDDLLLNVSGGCDSSSGDGDDDDYEDKNKWLIFSKI